MLFKVSNHIMIYNAKKIRLFQKIKKSPPEGIRIP